MDGMVLLWRQKGDRNNRSVTENQLDTMHEVLHLHRFEIAAVLFSDE
jgi:hypothetical protein